MRRVVIVGSTGSIGTQALDVVERSRELEVVGLAAASSWELLLEQARRFGVERIALADPDAAARAGEHAAVLAGAEGLVELITDTDCDLVLNALVGSAGLGPTVATLGEGIDLALANKESLVVGGELVMALAEATGAHLIPVDSEHSALFQLLEGQRPGSVDKLVLTASGGPFRGRTDLDGVTREEALAHPTWDMGGKITIDSATLMNKGLELIEAHHLFGVPYEQLDVVVHPQSIVHALVQLNDGASLAHLGYPDMRVPISYALHHPDRADVPVRPLDLAELGKLTFEPPDVRTFACLRLAREAAQAGGTAPCVLNAANEVAVHAFLRGELSFTGIARVIESTLAELPAQPVRHFQRPLRGGRAGARGGAGGGRVSWFLAFAGFAVLVILHELGHFTAAKAVGMRVEKFSLFFPPTVLSKKVGETEYAIGSIPAGGYVKISGMNPSEDLPEEVRDRAYHAQPVWKRIVVIAAGPAVNLVVAFVLLFIFYFAVGPYDVGVAAIEKSYPAAGTLHVDDRIVAVDGKKVAPDELTDAISAHHCPQDPPTAGCKAATPALLTVDRERRAPSDLADTRLRPQGEAHPDRLPVRLHERRARTSPSARRST